MMATRKGLVKKTALSQYGRPLKGGLIAIKLKDEDELVDVVIAKKGDEVVLSSGRGMAIRFSQADARAMGRNTSGVKGINLTKGDVLAGMVIADPEATLLTICERGYGKRTTFGPNEGLVEELPEGTEAELAAGEEGDASFEPPADSVISESAADEGTEEGDEGSSATRYRTQRRGGKGVRDIKTTDRNGPVVDVVSVTDGDEILIITKGGKLQRLAVKEISVIGRNTQGVRIMNMDEGDTIAALVRVPQDPMAAAAPDTPPTA
jgi:DNA gyrase subunit A